jgi:hypothetical protein
MLSPPSNKDTATSQAHYVGVNGYLQIQLVINDTIKCAAEKFEIPSLGHACSDKGYVYEILEEQGRLIRLYYTVDGYVLFLHTGKLSD